MTSVIVCIVVDVWILGQQTILKHITEVSSPVNI